MMLGIYLNVSWALMMCRTILLVSSAPVDNDWLNSEQVTRCHGIPCQEWDEIQEQLAELKEQAKKARPGEIEPGVLSVLQDDGDTIDGDIWPTLSHINSLKKNFQTRFKRKLATFGPNNTRWDDMPIEYYLDKKFNSSQVDAIQGATRHWEAQTCVTFREITYTEAVNRIDFSKPFLYFVKHHRCGTFVGKIPAASGQQIFLSDKCIQQWGAIVHEIGHILGFWHEHQRSDRDKFVTIFPDRMVAFADKSQYEVGNTRNNVRYDYGSVMHYWAWTNSASLDSITIEPHDMRYLYTIGQKIELSFLDAKLANIEYCSDRCSNAIACHNQGYQDPNNCHKCKCPDGFSGDQCDEVAPSENAVCGGNIDLTDEAGRRSTYITSPGYSEGKTYKDHTSCTWHIMAPKGYNVNLVFMNKSSDHFGMYCKYPVCFHWAEVKTTSSDMSITGPRFCCEYINRKSVLPGILTSDGRLMVLMMKSNFTTPDNDAVLREGFRAFVHISKDTNTATDKDDGATKKLTQQTPQTAPAPSPTGRKSKLDVVFVMDSSGSVGRENWSKIKTFTKDVISNLLDGLHDYKFAFVTFGSSAYINIHLDQYSSYRQFSDVISSLSWEQGSSNIADGLRKARQELLVTRPNIPNLVVLVTDGPATAEQSNTESEAQMLRQMENTHLLAIGLTTNVNTNVANQLQRMASSPTDKFVKIFDNYDGLNDVAMVVANVAEELGKPTDTVTRSSGCLDLVFLLNSSGNVRRYNWIILSKFIQTMMAELGQNDPYCNVKTAVISFSNEATYDVGLGCHGVDGGVLDAVMRIPWKQQQTNTASAIQMARERIPADHTCRRVVLLITNAQSNRNQQATPIQAILARHSGIELYVMGIGWNFGIAEAYDITRSSQRIMFVQQYILLLMTTTMDLAKKWLLKALEVKDATISYDTSNYYQGDVTGNGGILETTTRPTTTPTRKTTTTPKPTTTPQPTTTTPQPTTTTTPKPTTTTPKPTTTTPKPTTTPKETTTPKPTTTKQTTTPITITKQTTTQPTTIKQTVSTTVTTEKGTTANSFSWRCDFEEAGVPFCGMAQEDGGDQFDWTRNRGPTLSSHTGPDSAASNKYYIYIEASRPRKLDDTACVYTPEVPHDGEYCLHFQYHMYGYHVKELRVQEVSHDGDVTGLDLIGHGKSVKGHRNRAPVSWTERKQGVEGNTKWQTESLDIYLAGKSKIAFTGVRGAEYSGDIALDDISLHSGACTS